MPELDIHIGGKVFQVACQSGEEPYLLAAASTLDAEAQPLLAQGMRMPEARMLLMTGLMLADRMAGLQDKLRAAEEELRVARERVAVLASMPAEKVEVVVERLVEVPVVPPALIARLAELAEDAELLADVVEERAGALADAREG